MWLRSLIADKDEFVVIFKYLHENFRTELSNGDILTIIQKIKFPLHLDVGKVDCLNVNISNIISALFVLLIKSYNKNHTADLKEAFYDLYKVIKAEGIYHLFFEVDSLNMAEVIIPIDNIAFHQEEYCTLLSPDTKDTSIIYEIDPALDNSSLGDIVTNLSLDRIGEERALVILEFPKDFKFAKSIDFSEIFWPANLLARMYSVKDKNGDDQLPFKAIGNKRDLQCLDQIELL